MASEEFVVGLQDVKIAAWNGIRSYGTAIDLEAVSLYGFTLEAMSGRLEGDQVRVALYSVPIGGTGRIRFGFKDLTVFATLTAMTETSSTEGKALTIGRDDFPYFAINGLMDHDTGSGAVEVFLPKCKIMQSITIEGQFGATFLTPEIPFEFVYEDDVYKFGQIITRATAVAVAIPPAVLS